MVSIDSLGLEMPPVSPRTQLVSTSTHIFPTQMEPLTFGSLDVPAFPALPPMQYDLLTHGLDHLADGVQQCHLNSTVK